MSCGERDVLRVDMGQPIRLADTIANARSQAFFVLSQASRESTCDARTHTAFLLDPGNGFHRLLQIALCASCIDQRDIKGIVLQPRQ